MSGILVKHTASGAAKGLSSKIIAAVLIVTLVGAVGGAVYLSSQNNTPPDDSPFIPVDNNPSPSPTPYTPSNIDGDPTPAPSVQPTPCPSYVVNDPVVDPVGWGYEQSAHYIVSSRTSVNGTVYYGVYNATSARWLTSMSEATASDTTANALAAMTAGTLLLKDVAFDLALMNDIGDNVAVVESVNGLTRTFINPLDTQGSPYTVSVSGSDYFAQDKAGRYCYYSTNASYVGNQALELGSEVSLADGNYVLTNSWLVPSDTVFNLGKATITKQFNGNMIEKLGSGSATNIQILGGVLEGSSATYTGSGVYFVAVSDSLVSGVTVNNQKGDGIGFYFNCSFNTIENCRVENMTGTANIDTGIVISGDITGSSYQPCFGNKIMNNYVSNAENGIWNRKFVENTLISGNYINGTAGSEGIDFLSSYGGKIIGNTVYDADTEGIGVESTDGDYPYGTLIENNVIISAGYDGIFVSDATNMTIVGNDISWSGYNGICVQNDVRDLGYVGVSVTGNMITNINTQYYYDLRLSKVQNVTIIGNTMMENGIGIWAGATYLNIQGNSLAGVFNGATGVSVALTDLTSIIQGNQGVQGHNDLIYSKMITDVYGLGTVAYNMSVPAKVYMVPLQIQTTVTVTKIGFAQNSAASSNVTVGIYRDNGGSPAGGALLVQSASTATTGAYRGLEVTVTGTQLKAGLYWLAIESQSFIICYAPQTWLWTMGDLRMATFENNGGYGALPDTCPAVSRGNDGVSMWVGVSSIP